MRGSTRISQDGPRAVRQADRLQPVPGPAAQAGPPGCPALNLAESSPSPT